MNEKIENLLKEERKFPPSKQLTENANATSSWHEDADKNRLEFWEKQSNRLHKRELFELISNDWKESLLSP